MLLDRYNLHFGKVSSVEYGVYIFGGGIYKRPERRVNKYTIPGRSGDLTIDEGAFNNVEVTYQCILTDKFSDNYNAFLSALYAPFGYQRLEDSFDLTHYRQALFRSATDPKPGVNGEYGTFELKFDAKPQRWIKGSDSFTEIPVIHDTNNMYIGIVENPTQYDAYPILRIVGDGNVAIVGHYNRQYPVSVQSKVISIDESFRQIYPQLDYDCETEESYYPHNGQQVSANSYVTADDNIYIPLGDTAIRWYDWTNITHVQWKPRWWEI